MPFSKEEIVNLPLVISDPRFKTYLDAMETNPEAALQLYQWNAQVSAEFIFPLHVCEIAVRNAVSSILVKVHGDRWPWSNGFIQSLQNNKTHYSPQQNLRNVGRTQSTTGKVIAELNFAFWESLLTKRQDDKLWKRHLYTAFPNIKKNMSFKDDRRNLNFQLNEIRKFRNRIAHHEPIFQRDIVGEYSKILDTIRKCSNHAAIWVEREQKASKIIAEDPRRP